MKLRKYRHLLKTVNDYSVLPQEGSPSVNFNYLLTCQFYINLLLNAL